MVNDTDPKTPGTTPELAKQNARSKPTGRNGERGKKLAVIGVYEITYSHWLCKFPHRSVVAKNREMAERFCRAYELNTRNMILVRWHPRNKS